MTNNRHLTKGKIDENLVKHLAWLSRLNIPEEKISEFKPQLQDILEFFNQLDFVNTENVPPTFHAIKLEDVFRKDSPHESMAVEDALKNTKSQKDKYFKTRGMGVQE